LIRNLADTSSPTNVTGKVCIIGAGIAGLLLASRLRSHGMRVVVLESGYNEKPESADAFNAVIQLAQIYTGATLGRFRGLGGTSSQWGGQLIPMRPEDMAARPHVGIQGWPIEPETIMRYLAEIEELLCLCSGTYGQDFLRDWGSDSLDPFDDPELTLRFSKVPTFKRRNIATLLANFIRSDVDTVVWLNATVTEFELSRETGSLKSVTARDVNGRTLRTEAKLFVIAAGAIESTRLLLMLDAAHDGRVFEGCDALGRYFHDHISGPLAEFVPTALKRFNNAFGHRFVGTTMRSTRLELTTSAQTRDKVACAYGQVSMDTSSTSAFATLRQFLQSRQLGGTRADPRLLRKFIRQTPYFAAVGFWRFYYKQLYWSRDAIFRLHVAIEQVPFWGNRILLSAKRDALGAPMVAIDWRQRETELQTFRSYLRHFVSFWRRNGLENIARLKLLSSPDDLNENVLLSLRAGDVYHPAGSTRMGTNSREAVVDSELRVFGLPNLWVASTSTFPSLGTANPTLTLMLLTLRLGEHLCKFSRD
jgi:choline dehydrogenase-like flavoprotein